MMVGRSILGILIYEQEGQVCGSGRAWKGVCGRDKFGEVDLIWLVERERTCRTF